MTKHINCFNSLFKRLTTFYYRCKRLEYKYSWLPSTKDLNKYL